LFVTGRRRDADPEVVRDMWMAAANRGSTLDSSRTKEEHYRTNTPFRSRDFAMSQAPTTDNERYEQACNQAIAMCDGNMRSTIKALIMANEYLEAEVEELQAAVSMHRECTEFPPRVEAA
jgi:hypothetical protein